MTTAREWWAVAAIVLVALNLRPSVVAVGPLLAEIRADQALSATAAGVLTALPVLCFGVMAPIAPRIARRLGIERALLAVLLALIAGCVLRMIPTLWALFGGTVVIGAAIASGNVLLPALIKRDFAHRVGLLTALYSPSISFGGALGAGVTVPIATAAALDWRTALGGWALWALVALACWLPQLRRTARPAEPGHAARGLARQALAWQVTVYMGLQGLGFYAVGSWLAEVCVDRGYDSATAGALVAVQSVGGLVGGMIVPVLATRRPSQMWLAAAVTAVHVAGLALLLVPGLELPAVAIAGCAQGGALGLALTYMALRAPDSAHAAQLSGMAHTGGYALAALGPFAFGALHDLSGGWTIPFVAVLILQLPQGLAGVLAGRERVLRREERPSPVPA